ncbi:MAG: DUF4114 domain-containing protein [Proteobacteria bacterium]|nr:DUF4114 domain-containing protein [Pseudomonadota bacterium]
MDSTNLEASTLEAFQNAKKGNVLFNTADSGKSCGTNLIQSGQVSFEFTLPAKSSVVFFLVANGKLKDGRQGSKLVRFSVSALNQGGYDQLLTFYSENGRNGEGGPQAIIALEDLSLATGAPLDYSDAIIHINGLIPSQPYCDCSE